jgi:hypothetical protein
MRNWNNVRKTLSKIIYVEIDQELSDMDLMSRAERKKEYISNQQRLIEKRQREWLLKHGKSHLLDF